MWSQKVVTMKPVSDAPTLVSAPVSKPAPAPVAEPGIDAQISSRTRLALSEAKARGVKLGAAGADNIRATVEKRINAADAFARQHQALFAELQSRGLTHRAMAAELNAKGVTAAKGGEWTHGQVQRILNRYADWVSKSAQAPVPPSPSE